MKRIGIKSALAAMILMTSCSANRPEIPPHIIVEPTKIVTDYGSFHVSKDQHDKLVCEFKRQSALTPEERGKERMMTWAYIDVLRHVCGDSMVDRIQHDQMVSLAKTVVYGIPPSSARKLVGIKGLESISKN